MPNAILRAGPYASSRNRLRLLQFFSKETGIEQGKNSVNASNTNWSNADWRAFFYASYGNQVNNERTEVNSGYVGLNGASGSKESLPTVFTVEWPSVGGGADPLLGGGFFYQATESFKLKLKYKFWNGYSLIQIRIVGEQIENNHQFLAHTIAPAGGGGSFPGPNIDDEYEIELPASVLGKISINMDGEGLDAIAGTNWTLELTTA